MLEQIHQWVENTLKRDFQEEQEPLGLFCDNFEGQKADIFKKSIEPLGSIVWYGVANATDIW